MKRVFLIVLDSFGIGQMPDAEKFGDYGVDTLGTVSKSPYFSMPNMEKLGLFQIEGTSAESKVTDITGRVARMAEASMGKDTTIGHWEIAGIYSPTASPKRYWRRLRKQPAEECSATSRIPVRKSLKYTATSMSKRVI